MRWPLAEVLEVLGLPPGEGAAGGLVVDSVETDSRAVGPGALFAALPGARADGHDFVAAAVAAGAVAVLRRRDRPPPPLRHPVVDLAVDDTVAAYRALAAAWRRRFAGPVGAVAGSIGKTTTTALAAALVGGRHAPTHRTPPERNGWIGLPKTALALRASHAAAVFEIGTDAPGATRAQARLVRPDALVLTGIAEEHLDRLGDLDGVAREQRDAFVETAAAGGTLVVVVDDARVAAAADSLRDAPRLDVTLAEGARPGPRCLVGRRDAAARTLTLEGGGLDRAVCLPLPLPGAHNARNQLAAAGLAVALGADAAALERGLVAFTPPRGRSDVRHLPGGITLLADHYNASPASMRAAFALAAELRGGGRLVVALGDMLELGRDEEAHHRALAAPLRALAPDALFLHGPRMAWLADAFGPAARHVADPSALAAALAETLRPGDVLLVKGSRSMRMERVVPDAPDLGF